MITLKKRTKMFLFMYETVFMVLTVSMVIIRCSAEVDIQVIHKPDKCERMVGRSSFVTMHYSGFTLNGNKIESTYDRGVPIEFQTGLGMVFLGLDEGVLGMCVGEKRKLTIPPDRMVLANAEKHPLVKEGEGAIYEVEVLDIAGSATMNSFRWLDENEDKKLSKDEIRKLIQMTLHSNAQFSHLKEDNVLDFYVAMHDVNNDSFVSEEEFEKSFLPTQGERGKLREFGKPSKEEL